MSNSIKLLIVEDDEQDQMIIRELLSGSKRMNYEITLTDCSKKAESLCKDHSFDAILLDLNLVDSQGISTFIKLYNVSESTPIIILTGLQDEDFATKLIGLGAQDYILKQELTKTLIRKSIQYAIERNNLKLKLADVTQQKIMKLDLDNLEKLSEGEKSVITSKLYANLSLQQASKEKFTELVQQLEIIFENHYESIIVESNFNRSEIMKSFAFQLGFFQATPKDVTSIYLAALKELDSKVPNEKMKLLFSEGKMLLIELMGYLVTYYREH